MSPKKTQRDHFAIDPTADSLDYNRTSVFHGKRKTVATVQNKMYAETLENPDKNSKLKVRYKNNRETVEYLRDTTESLTGDGHDHFDSNMSSMMQQNRI